MSIIPLIRELFAAYPNIVASVETIAVYDHLLSDIPVAELRIVIDQAIAECKFLPTVAEIRDQWLALPGRLQGPSVADAWADVQKQIIRTGRMGLPVFSDVLTARVVQAMGWRELCLSENQIADRAHFMRLYEQMVNQRLQADRLLPAAREFAQRQALVDATQPCVSDQEGTPLPLPSQQTTPKPVS